MNTSKKIIDNLSRIYYIGFVTKIIYALAEPFNASSHMGPFLKPNSFRERMRLATRALRDYDFDTIAFRGMSGAFIGPVLAARLNKQMILVRKPEDDSHSSLRVEGHTAAKRYIIVDDFKSSGKTKDLIIAAVARFSPEAQCLGLLEVKQIRPEHFSEFGSISLV